MKKLNFIILSAGFLSVGNIFGSGILSKIWNLVSGESNQPAQPQTELRILDPQHFLNRGMPPQSAPSEEEIVLEEVHLGAAPNVFTDHNRCMHVHNNYFPRDKAKQIESMVIWYPYYEMDSVVNRPRGFNFPRVRNVIIKCSLEESLWPFGAAFPKLTQLYVCSGQKLVGSAPENCKQLYSDLFCEPRRIVPEVKINFTVPQKWATRVFTPYDLQVERFFTSLQRAFSSNFLNNVVAVPSIKMYDFVAQVPNILWYDPFDLKRCDDDTHERGSSAFLILTIEKALERALSWFKQEDFNTDNVFQNSEEVILQKIIDDPIPTLNLIVPNVTKEIIDEQQNEALRLICSSLYWHKKDHHLLSSREIRMMRYSPKQEDYKSLSLWKIKNTICCLQSTDVGPEILRRWYTEKNNNDLNKLAILLCVVSGASWSHLITHRLLQKDMDFIKTMIFLSQSFLQKDFFDFQISTYLFNLIRNDAIEEFVTHVNRSNISANANIMGIPLIAIAALFGSIQIVNYLRFNNADLTPNLWFFAVAGHNPELIHLLEENHVPIENLENLLIVSRSLGYNDIFTYLVDNHSPLERSPRPGQDRLCRNAFLTQVFDSDPENPVDALWREFDFRYLSGISAVDYDDLKKLEQEEVDEQSGYDFNDYVNQIMIITNVPKTVSLDEIRQSYPNVILLRYKDDPYTNVVVSSENSHVLKATPFTLEQACDLINFDGFSIFVKKLLHDVKIERGSIYYPYVSSAE